MPLQIIAFKGYALPDRADGEPLQVVDGAPLAATAASFAGSYTVPDDCRLIKIIGTGSITWSGIANAETFNGVEFRGVRAGTQFTVA